jgi:hypothetical protein
MEFGVLSNDLDPNGAPLTANLVTTTTGGIVTLNQDGSFTYDPYPDFYGRDSFTYILSNGTSTSSEALVEITVTPVNNAPVSVRIDSIGNGTSVFPIGSIALSGSFLDVDVEDTEHTATWTLRHAVSNETVYVQVSGTVFSETQTVRDTINFASAALGPGVYTLTLGVDDGHGGEGFSNSELFVVYDPSEGFVTGGGWINSPAGAYVADPTLIGKATFGFVSKYEKGAIVPTGETEFQFKVANLNFHSSSYDWLVVAGARAQYKGVGKINGTGDYGFMLTAIDGQVNDGGGVDKFRMKIWDKANGEVLVYDNKLGASDDALPSTALGGGQIVIHKNGSNLTATSTGTVANGVMLTQPMLDAAVADATAAWMAAGVSKRRLTALGSIDIAIAQFASATLGLAPSSTKKIWLDVDGAGLGWSVDVGGYHLPSAVRHEIGHVLGFDHDVMGESLAPGDIQATGAQFAADSRSTLFRSDGYVSDPLNALDAVFEGIESSRGGLRPPLRRGTLRFEELRPFNSVDLLTSRRDTSLSDEVDYVFDSPDDEVDGSITGSRSRADRDDVKTGRNSRGRGQRLFVDEELADSLP